MGDILMSYHIMIRGDSVMSYHIMIRGDNVMSYHIMMSQWSDLHNVNTVLLM